MAWALWLTCWQLVSRTGDLLRGKFRAKHAWDPQFETHRGRMLMEEVPDSDVLRMLLHYPPGKVDAPGAQGPTKTVLVDSDPDALSCGAAIARMLAGDPLCPGEEATSVPLFRDPVTGKEMTYAFADRLFRLALTSVGYADLGAGQHSLRRGGCTAACAVGGRYVSACLGNWRSDCDARYLFPLRDRCEAATLAMGRGAEGPLADQLGSVVVHRR